MKNPDGPYPGRQLFIGLTPAQEVCFAYLVTGRSPQTRERKAIQVENTISIGPLGEALYDPLRHYSAIKYDDKTGVLAASNGIQTESVYEIYRLLVNVASSPEQDYLVKILDGANAEPDSYHTPRIAGVIIPGSNGVAVQAWLGIKIAGRPAIVHRVKAKAGTLSGIATYAGDLAKPQAREANSPLSTIEYGGGTATELAEYIFTISEAIYENNDIRVSAVGGLFHEGKWHLGIKNAR